MTRLVKLTLFACALALAGLGASSFAAADKFARPCIVCNPGNGPRDVGIDHSGFRSASAFQREFPDELRDRCRLVAPWASAR